MILEIITMSNNFKIKYIKPNEAYGPLNKAINNSTETLVEFYKIHDNFEYFISRYFLTTINKLIQENKGLCLSGSDKIYISEKTLSTLIKNTK